MSLQFLPPSVDLSLSETHSALVVLLHQLTVHWIPRKISRRRSRYVLSFIYLFVQPLPHSSYQRRYGYDTSTFSPKPINILSGYLEDLGCSTPVHILPGDRDPSGVILPQQPFPKAMFGPVSSLDSFFCESNPTKMKICPASQVASEVDLDPSSTCHLLLHSGQPLNDMFKYVPTPPITRLSLAEMTLRWRHMAPTAPDTLWCHPYFTGDPFVLDETPDVYVIGNQPHFATKLVQNAAGDVRCRVVLVPDFANTGQVVLLNTTTLAVKMVKIVAEGFQTSSP